MSYTDDLPGGYGYVDPRVELAAWRKVKEQVEGEWRVGVLARLRKGEAMTSDLAEVTGVKPGKEYGRFLVLLKSLKRYGQIRKVGQRKAAIHMNNVWELRK